MSCEGITIETSALDEVIEVGVVGPQGPSGAAGVGVPTGGITGYVLAKKTTDDYDTEWVAQTGGGGNFSSPPPIGDVTPNTGAFTNLSAVTANFTTISASGLATLPHIHGSLAGNLYIHVKNVSGGALSRGAPVYIVGNVGDTDRVEVAAADFDDPTKMPAVGLLDQELAQNGTGDAIIVGELPSANTAAYSLNQELFVGNAGTITGVRPATGEIQSVGIVSRVQSNSGVIVVNMQARRDPLATVATSGDYDDLDNKPTLGNSASLDVGTTAGTVAAGDDARLSDTRTPTSHAASHAAAGSDPLAPSDIGAANASHTHDLDDLTRTGVVSGDIIVRNDNNDGWDTINGSLWAGQNISAGDIGAAASNHTHGNLTNDGKVGSTAGSPLKTGTAGVVEAGAFGTSAGQFAEGNHTHTQLHDRSHAITSTSDHTAGNHKIFYSNASGEIVELALGASGTVLTSGGTAAAPSFEAASGGGATNLWIPASAWIPKTTAGCGVDSRETSTNDQNFDELLFDAGSDEFADALVIMPSNYNNGTITARFYWTAASGSGGVAWAIQGRAFANDDALDTAAGTAQLVTDTLIAANDMHVSSATSAVTIGGTPAANTPIQFTIYRDVSDAGDDLAVDARLLGVEIVFN